MGFIDYVLSPVLQPLVDTNVILGIFVVSLLGALLSTFANKYFSDQNEIKRLKDEQKRHQERMKEARSNPEQLAGVQKEMSQTALELMRHSFKPMFITLIPFWLLFIWMNAHLGFDPIMPGEEFVLRATFENGDGVVRLVPPKGIELLEKSTKDVNGTVDFRLKAMDEGEYFIDVEYNGEIFTKETLVAKSHTYADQTKPFKDKDITSLQLAYEKLTPLGDFSVFGWKPGWLALYILFSIGFTLSFKKVFGLQ